MNQQKHPSVTPIIYPQTTFERKIGFDVLRQLIATNCISATGRELVASMAFTTDFDDVKRRLMQVDEMLRIIRGPEVLPIGNIIDAPEWLLQARVPGTFIDVAQLVALRRALDSVAQVLRFFGRHKDADTGISEYPELADVACDLDASPEVLDAINKVLTPTGEIKDNASPELAEIRSQLSTIGNRIASALRRVVREGIRDGILEADITPVMRDGRLVVPVAPMHKRSLQGIVHDESASGKTYFIEPAAVVELNNQQRELEIAERHEIIRILSRVTDQIRPHIDQIMLTSATMGQLDFIAAKARFAAEIDACLPNLNPQPEFEWYGARHPGLQLTLQKQGREIVPINLKLDAQHRILVISGPNAGGKSVTLKTAGIVQYMTQCGLLPTVHDNSHVGMVDGIFADIGDDQSIEDDLSTYSSHLRAMRYTLAHANSHCLILIDEFGAGTEPQIGGAIAQALLTRFNANGAWGVITTHYQNLKTLAEDTPGLVNGSMLYDRQRMCPLFKLEIGHAGSSFAIEIARKTGLPADVIDDASEIVGSDYINLDKYLLDVARDKRYWAEKRQQVRQREKHLEDVIARYEAEASQLHTSRREIIDDARRQAREILEGSNASIERTIHEIRQAQAERQATLDARARLQADKTSLEKELPNKDDHPLLKRVPKSRKKPQPVAEQTPKTEERALRVGDNVVLDQQGQPGTLLEFVDAKKAVVAFGAVKMTVPIKRLALTMRRKAAATGNASSFVTAATTNEMRQRQLKFRPEIDVRGMRADEALQAVTYFIDDALQFNAQRVRILHGTGTGALRMAIRQYLDTVAGVQSAHDEDVRFGGAGITVVEL